MLSDQTNSCSDQVHGVLVYECTVQSLGLFCCEEQLQLSYIYFIFIFLFFCTETKQSSDFEHSISLCLVRLLWFCIVAQLGFVLEHFER